MASEFFVCHITPPDAASLCSQFFHFFLQYFPNPQWEICSVALAFLLVKNLAILGCHAPLTLLSITFLPLTLLSSRIYKTAHNVVLEATLVLQRSHQRPPYTTLLANGLLHPPIPVSSHSQYSTLGNATFSPHAQPHSKFLSTTRSTRPSRSTYEFGTCLPFHVCFPSILCPIMALTCAISSCRL